MTEETIRIPQETYQKEALYMAVRQRHSDDFDRMLSIVPDEKKK